MWTLIDENKVQFDENNKKLLKNVWKFIQMKMFENENCKYLQMKIENWKIINFEN